MQLGVLSGFKFKDFFSSNPLVVLLFLSFLLIAGAKTVLSLSFVSPFVLGDESLYANMARSIASDWYTGLTYGFYPPGYSLLLSPIYLLTSDQATAYSAILVINSVVTSLILFPSFFILKRFIRPNIALLGSILIALSPSVTTYSFVIFSENLFTLLFMLSAWALIKMREHNNKFFAALAGFLLFALFLTRATGIAVIAAFLFVVVYDFIKEKMSVRAIATSYYVSAIFFFAPLVIWFFYTISIGAAGLPKAPVYVPGSYSPSAYLSSLLQVFSDSHSFLTFLGLFSNQLAFLIVSSFFLFFATAVISFLLIQHVKRKDSFIVLVIYSAFSSLFLVVISATHMYRGLTVVLSPGYLVYGRYIAPAVPLLLVIGLIGFFYLRFRKNNFLHISLLFLFLLLISFPLGSISRYRFPSNMPIHYLLSYNTASTGIQEFLQPVFMLFFYAIASLVFIFAYLRSKQKDKIIAISIIFFCLVSVAAFIPAYSQARSNSFKTHDANVIGRYLQSNANESTVLIMPLLPGNPVVNGRIRYMADFWVQVKVIGVDYDITADSNFTSLPDADYLLSRHLLPYDVVAEDPDGTRLYLLNSRAS